MSRVALRIIPLTLLTVAACTDAPTALAPDRADNATASASMTVVMSNLNSPRGLEWGPEGGLYVAEAGTTASTGACTTVMDGARFITRCYSGTGSISRLWKGKQERVASGLPSTFLVQSGFASGPQDISFQGRGNGYVAIGWGGDPALRSALGEAAETAGTLIRLQPSGKWSVVADIAGFEGANNPAGGPVDSNPYGVLAEAGRQYVVDAGGNSLLEVTANGTISFITTFPSTPAPAPWMQAESVPTKVKRGPDGALYVSTLSGVPFLAGSAAIYRVVPGQAPQLHAGGFKTITDFDFGPDGSIYVVQFATAPIFFGGPGALIRVAPNGTRSTVTTDLFQPTGVAVGDDGNVYVSNKGTLPAVGEVLRIVP